MQQDKDDISNMRENVQPTVEQGFSVVEDGIKTISSRQDKGKIFIDETKVKNRPR